MSKSIQELLSVRIEKLVHGGQGLAELPDGRKVFVWNGLPGETVRIRLIKQKRSYAEAIAEEIVEASQERIAPEETNYLATSPWQIMTFEAENKYKKAIVKELFQQAHIKLPEFILSTGREEQPEQKSHFLPGTMRNPLAGVSYGYRNKMEYSFWGDDDGLHLALHQRGSHGKHIVTGSKLAMPSVDKAANALCVQLNGMGVRASDLKTIIVRSDQAGKAVASLFVKPKSFPNLKLPADVEGLRVYHSNPKSPASVPTKLLQEIGSVLLADNLLGQEFIYDVDSFFQVNIPIFEGALQRIKDEVQADTLTDMYAGVGSIGLSVATDSVQLVELDSASAAMARENLVKSSLQGEVIEASTEKALDYITGDRPIIFDPPRAGLHAKVVERVLEALPPQVVYLSCNPATQARDLALLQQAYTIKQFEVYNFFPRTPHIETLVILDRK